jgi:hypothetical protein
MKKLALVLVAALAVATFASAQGMPWGAYPNSTAQAQLIKVDGKLALINGMIGLTSGGKTYYTPMLGRLVGFVSGLNEGASVRLEGYEYPLSYAPGFSTLAVTKLTLNGKDYDLSSSGGFGHGMGGMRGGTRGRR